MNIMEKQKRRGNFSLEEVQALCLFVRENTGDLFGKGQHPGLKVKARKNRAWDQGVEALKAHGVAPSRTGADLRLSWNEMAYRARKYHDKRNQTGGGPKPQVNLKYEMVLEALNDVCVKGFDEASSEAGIVAKDNGELGNHQDKAATSMLTGMMEVEELEEEREEEEELVVEVPDVDQLEEEPYLDRPRKKRVPDQTFQDKILSVEIQKVNALNEIAAILKLILAKCPSTI